MYIIVLGRFNQQVEAQHMIKSFYNVEAMLNSLSQKQAPPLLT